MSINYHELAITVITNVLFISLFIGIFFFTYGGYIEKQVVKNQMEFLADEITDSVHIFGPNAKELLKNRINTLPPLDFGELDTIVAKMNLNVLYKAIVSNIFLIIFISLIVYFTYAKSDKSFTIKNILIKNAIILVFVALTEYSFLNFFGSKYMSLNPNIVKHAIVKNIKNIVNNF